MCNQYRMLVQSLEQLAAEYAGKIDFGKINVDDNRIGSNHFGLHAIPTLITLKKGV